VSVFDSSGRMTSWTHVASGETVTYTFDGAGAGTSARVATMTGPDGGVATFAYSGSLLATITAPAGRVVTLTHTGTDLTRVADPTGKNHDFTYASHRLTCDTRQTAKVSYAYDAYGLLDSYTLGADPLVDPGMGAGLGAGSTAREGGGVVATYTDALNFVWTTWFNSFGQVVQTLDPVGALRQYERDASGYVTKYTDALNRVTSYVVDASGRVTSETRPDGSDAAG
jgi:YD repeat-containing protein